MPTGPTTAPWRCLRAKMGSVSCQPFLTSLPKINRSLGLSLVADLWLPNSMASRRSWRRSSSSIGSNGRWAPCIRVFLARGHRGWPCSTGSRMAVGWNSLPWTKRRVNVLEEDRLQVVVIRLEDLEVRPGSQFRQLKFEGGFGPRGRMPG